MNIAVCIKQVPNFANNSVDLETGLIKRALLSSSINPSDLSALEAALQLKEKFITQGLEAKVYAFSMGPQSAVKILSDSFSLGVDNAYLVNDKAFAGSDVISTSYALYQAIRSCEENLNIKFNAILCGNQTTDGGTSFIYTALATRFDYPLLPYAESIDLTKNLSSFSITTMQNMGNLLQKIEAKMPVVISILPENFPPRMPTLKLKMLAKKKSVETITLADLEDKNINNYGMKGAKTKVVKSYSPQIKSQNTIIDAEEIGYKQLHQTINDLINENRA